MFDKVLNDYFIIIAKELAGWAKVHVYSKKIVDQEDEHTTAFRYSRAFGIYEWIVMSFGIKKEVPIY